MIRCRDRGTTLLEALLAMALLALLLSAGLQAMDAIVTADRRSSTSIVLDAEAEFLRRRIADALSDADAVLSPAGESDVLELRTGDGGIARFTADRGYLTFARDDGPSIPLNGGDTRLTALRFTRSVFHGRPDEIAVALTLTDSTVLPPLACDVSFTYRLPR
jgi:type II secretory pathway pseudopilin PulG